MGRLTTHILDTAKGRPGTGIAIELFAIDGETRRRLASVTSNNDGRTDAPLLADEACVAGTYELVFHVADYHRRSGEDLADPPFLDAIPIRFSIADPAKHYHVPLLVSPWAYSTYRGS